MVEAAVGGVAQAEAAAVDGVAQAEVEEGMGVEVVDGAEEVAAMEAAVVVKLRPVRLRLLLPLHAKPRRRLQ